MTLLWRAATFLMTPNFTGTNNLYTADAVDRLFDWLGAGNQLPVALAVFGSLDYRHALNKLSAAHNFDVRRIVRRTRSLATEQVAAGDSVRRPTTVEALGEVRSLGINDAFHTHSHRILIAVSLEVALEDVRHGSEWFGPHGLVTEPLFAHLFGDQVVCLLNSREELGLWVVSLSPQIRLQLPSRPRESSLTSYHRACVKGLWRCPPWLF